MERRQLGSQGPEITVIGHGAWEAGADFWEGDRTDDDALDAMRAAVDAGINWIDTAEAYGRGHSEELVGRIARERPGEVLVFTKVAHFISGARPEEIHRAIRGSLGRLGLDRVDLYQIHWPAEQVVPVEETWGAMAEIAQQGLARWVGVSNFRRDLLERCLPIRHVDSVQNQLSLLWQRDRDELLPWLAEHGIGYLAYGPLGFGLLTGRIGVETTFGDRDWRSGKRNIGYYDHFFAPDKIQLHVGKVERLKAVADRLGVTPAELALRAIADIPGVTGVIAGSRNPDHVRSNASAGSIELDEATRTEIDAIFGR